MARLRSAVRVIQRLQDEFTRKKRGGNPSAFATWSAGKAGESGAVGSPSFASLASGELQSRTQWVKSREAEPQTVAWASCPSPHGQDARATNLTCLHHVSKLKESSATPWMSGEISLDPLPLLGFCLASFSDKKPDMGEQVWRGLCAGVGREFTTTHWSVVLAAGSSDSSQAAEALEQLCRAYWFPLYAYVRRRKRPASGAP